MSSYTNLPSTSTASGSGHSFNYQQNPQTLKIFTVLEEIQPLSLHTAAYSSVLLPYNIWTVPAEQNANGPMSRQYNVTFNNNHQHHSIEGPSSSAFITCSRCKERAPTTRCLECNYSSCHQCCRLLTPVCQQRGHTLLPIHQPSPIGAKRNSVNNEKEVILCNIHGDQVRYYCELCSILICQECTQLVHKYHNKSPIIDTLDMCRTDVLRAIEDTKTGIKAIETAIDRTAAMSDICEKDTDEATVEIRKAMRCHAQAIEDREKYLLDLVEKMRREKMNDYTSHMITLRGMLAGLAHNHDTLARSIDSKGIDLIKAREKGNVQLDYYTCKLKSMSVKEERIVFVPPNYDLLEKMKIQCHVQFAPPSSLDSISFTSPTVSRQFMPPSHQSMPPSHQSMPPSHQSMPPSHQSMPPSHQSMPPSHQSMPPSHQSMPPSHQSMPPSHQSMPPSHQSMPPSHQSMPPSHQSMPPSHQSMPPSHHSMPPSHHSMPPSHQSMPPSHQSMPPSHQSMPPSHQSMPPSHQSMPPSHQSMPPSHQSMPPSHQSIPPSHQSMPPSQSIQSVQSFQNHNYNMSESSRLRSLPEYGSHISSLYPNAGHGIGQAIPGSCMSVSVGPSGNLPGFPVFSFAHEGNAKGQLSKPWGLCVDFYGNIIVADRRNNRIQIFNKKGQFKTMFGNQGSEPGELKLPTGITTDCFGRIIVADKDNHRIQIFTMKGMPVMNFGSYGNQCGQFQYPWDVAVNTLGNIVVTDTCNHRIQMFTSNGIFKKMYVFEGPVRAKKMLKGVTNPRGVCFLKSGNILVSDFENHRLLMLDPTLSKVLHCIGREGPAVWQLNRPSGIMTDDYGRIIVVDSKNNRILVLTPEFHVMGAVILNSPELDDTDELHGLRVRPSDVALTPEGHIVVMSETMRSSASAISRKKRHIKVFVL